MTFPGLLFSLSALQICLQTHLRIFLNWYCKCFIQNPRKIFSSIFQVTGRCFILPVSERASSLSPHCLLLNPTKFVPTPLIGSSWNWGNSRGRASCSCPLVYPVSSFSNSTDVSPYQTFISPKTNIFYQGDTCKNIVYQRYINKNIVHVHNIIPCKACSKITHIQVLLWLQQTSDRNWWLSSIVSCQNISPSLCCISWAENHQRHKVWKWIALTGSRLIRMIWGINRLFSIVHRRSEIFLGFAITISYAWHKEMTS